MIRLAILICAALAAHPATGQAVGVTQPVRAGQPITAAHLTFLDLFAPDGVTDPRDVIGLEARVNLFPGRPLRPQDLGAPTVIARNAVVPLIFQRGGLTITLEGRALSRAGAGEAVRVLNLSSRSTVLGTATQAGAVIVN